LITEGLATAARGIVGRSGLRHLAEAEGISIKRPYASAVHDLDVDVGDARLVASYSPAGEVVVVAVHGASEGTRDSFLLRHLHHVLPTIGVGVVTFDRRGEGASSGEPSRGRFEVQVADTLAVVQALDARTVGLWGYSQGGWIAPLAAVESDLISFVIGVASTGVAPSRQMRYAVAEQLRRAGYDTETIDRAVGLRLAFEAEVHGGDVSREHLVDALRAASREAWWELAFLPETPLDPGDRAQWVAEMDFDPVQSFCQVAVPVLLF
jgi:hypothetical protein